MAVVCVAYAPPDEALAGSVLAAVRASGFDALALAGMEAEHDRSPDRVAVVVLWTANSVSDPWAHAVAAQAGDRLVNVTWGVSSPPAPFDALESFPLDDWNLGADESSWLRLEGELTRRARPPSLIRSSPTAPPGDEPPTPRRLTASSLEALTRERVGAAYEGVAPFATAAVGARLEPAAASAYAAAPPPLAPAPAPQPAGRARSAGRLGWMAPAAVAVVGVVGATAFVQTLALKPRTEAASAPTAAAAENAAAAPGPTTDQQDANAAASAENPVVVGAPFVPHGTLYGDAAGASPLIIQARRPIAIEIRDANARVYFKQILQPGEAYRVPRVPDVTVDVSDANGAELFQDGVSKGVLPQTEMQLPTTGPTDGKVAPANVIGVAPLIGVLAAGASAPVPPPIDEEPQPVDVSAFTPEAMHAGDKVLVQIYLHPIDQAAVAFDRARAADPEARVRGTATLDVELTKGAKVCISLEAGPAFEVDEPLQFAIWNGRPCARQFVVSASEQAQLAPHVLVARLLVDGVPVGRLAFTMRVVGREREIADARRLRGDKARRYTRAFLSYSKFDRPEVLKAAQALRASGIGFFQDILSIEPGEEWRTRLFAEIDQCDLFLLFWSSHSAKSDWVLREAQYALGRRHGSSDELPDVTPIVLEGPPIPRPPDELSSLHFNDMLRYVVAAAEMEAKARNSPDA